jgi:receptor protein-tyrosine kinase
MPIMQSRDSSPGSLDHLRYALGEEPLCVLITSAIEGEGKTMLAAQLACRCGKIGALTLLIDGDLHRSCLDSLLEICSEPGLAEAAGGADFRDLIIPAQGGVFHLLMCGAPGDAGVVLRSEKLGPLFDDLKGRFDIIIIDSPPILTHPDALILSKWADRVILATRYGLSCLPEVERAVSLLKDTPILVLNGYRAEGCGPFCGGGVAPASRKGDRIAVK